MARPNRLGREEFVFQFGIADERFLGMVHMKEEELCMNMYIYKYRESNRDNKRFGSQYSVRISYACAEHVDSMLMHELARVT